MKIKMEPFLAKGKIVAPPSKSMAHRMLMAAGLATGTSRVSNIAFSEDMKATIGILEALGAVCDIKGNDVLVTGIGGKVQQSNQALNCRESGSTLRFFVPLVLTSENAYEFVGAKRLFERPLGIYEDICKKQKIEFCKKESGLYVNGQLKSGTFQVAGNISSQFITGLLYALPLLEGESHLEILPPIESKAYIEMTLETLALFGIQIEKSENCYHIPGNQSYQAKDVVVEGDYSNAAFLDAFNLIGGDVQVGGLRKDSLQGDQVYQAYYQALCDGTPSLDISDCPDLGPVLMGMAASLHGAEFTGTKRLAIKESDRGAAMAAELAKFGVLCKVEENRIVVPNTPLKSPNMATESHNDHRIAMTMALLLSQTGGELEGADAVNKSYPNFYEDIIKLGAQVEEC